jgi:hypothetical protein
MDSHVPLVEDESETRKRRIVLTSLEDEHILFPRAEGCDRLTISLFECNGQLLDLKKNL